MENAHERNRTYVTKSHYVALLLPQGVAGPQLPCFLNLKNNPEILDFYEKFPKVSQPNGSQVLVSMYSRPLILLNQMITQD